MIQAEDKYFIFDQPRKGILKEIAKVIVYNLEIFCYKLVYLFSRKKTVDKKYNVAICAIFKNEAPYLKEWLEFNHLVGVSHFYMYNNNSEDEYLEILAPYIEKGIVTLVEWPHNQKQMECYMDCIEKYSCESKWIGFIDIDEFIVPKVDDNIYDFLKKYEKRAGAVNIYWKLFGTSGRMDRDIKGLVTEDFTVCWPKYCNIGKCFYNTAFSFNASSSKAKQLHHKFWASNRMLDLPPYNIFGKLCVGNINRAKQSDFPIQINHYFTKSYKEYAMKRAKGDVYFKINPHDEEYFYEHEMKCTSVDYAAYKYLNKLKKMMEIE